MTCGPTWNNVNNIGCVRTDAKELALPSYVWQPFHLHSVTNYTSSSIGNTELDGPFERNGFSVCAEYSQMEYVFEEL